MVFIGEPGMVYAQVEGEWVPIGTLEPGSLTFGPDTPPPPAQPVITNASALTIEVTWDDPTFLAVKSLLLGLPSLDRYQLALPCGAPRCHNQRCRKYLDVEYGPDEFFCSWVCQMRWYEARQEA